MDLARYVVDAVVLEGRSCREVARSHGCSKSNEGIRSQITSIALTTDTSVRQASQY